MFRVFGAIGRFFRAIGYLLTGKVDKQTDKVMKDPAVIRATFDGIIREKKSRINEYKSAVARLVAQKEKKVQQVKNLTDELTKLRNLQAGAAGTAKVRASDLKVQGLDDAAIMQDAKVMQARATFADCSSTIEEKEKRIAELEGDINGYQDGIKNHKIQLTNLAREIDKIKDEAADTVADVITSQEEKELADCLSGISEDGTGAELEKMREIRNHAKAEATVASELAGTDHKRIEAEYEQFAVENAANDEFNALLGLGKTPEQKIEEIESKLDESAKAVSE